MHYLSLCSDPQVSACVTWKQKGTDNQSLGGYFKSDSAKQQCSILPLMKSQNTK